MRSTFRILVTLCLTVLVATSVMAQESYIEDRQDATAPTFFGETGLFQTMSGSTLEKGRYSAGIYLNAFRYTIAPAPEYTAPSRRDYDYMAVLENRFTASIGYGITDRWEMNLQLPIVGIQSNDGDRAGYLKGYPYIGKFADNGVGNLHLGTKFGLLSPENKHKLAITSYIDFGTGETDSGISTGTLDWGIGLAWNRDVYYASAYFVNNSERDADPSPIGTKYIVANEARVDFGVNIPMNWFGATNWITEVNTVWYEAGDGQPDDIVSLSTGIRHWMDNTPWGFSFAVRENFSALFRDASSSGLGFLAGIHYAPVRQTKISPPPPPVAVPLPPPVPPAQVQPVPVAQPQTPQELRTDVVGFEENSARVTNIGKALLDDVALRMRQEPASTATVTGYAAANEATGDDNDLDRRRAEAVRDYLVSRHKIDSERINVESGGTRDEMGNNMVAVVKLVVR